MATATVNMYTRIPADLNEKLEAYLKESGETKTEIVRQALEAYLKEQK